MDRAGGDDRGPTETKAHDYTPPPPQDGEPFVAKLEQPIEEGDADFVGANMPALENLIVRHQARAHGIPEMQHRARIVRDRHEPPAEKRLAPRRS